MTKMLYVLTEKQENLKDCNIAMRPFHLHLAFPWDHEGSSDSVHAAFKN